MKSLASSLLRIAAFLVVGLLAGLPQAGAQPASSSGDLIVGVHANPPFVMKDGDRFSGMAIDLWEEVAAKLGRDYAYVEFPSVGALVDATAEGAIDIAVVNLAVTHARAERVDFTQPWLDGGSRILISEERGAGWGRILAGLSDAGFLRAYAWIGGVILAATLLFTLFDRRFNPDFPGRWRDGAAESFYTVMSIAVSGKPPARKNLFGWLGRIWQGLWLICGVAILAFVTSSVTSVMTTLSLAGHVGGLDDLSGKTVGVMAGSSQEEFAREEGMRIIRYLDLDDAAAAVMEGRVDAAIYDARTLEYYVHTHPDLPLRVVGRLFEKRKYAFATPHRSPLQRPVTLELLHMVDAGHVVELLDFYLGADR